jgi:hypothetical protein
MPSTFLPNPIAFPALCQMFELPGLNYTTAKPRKNPNNQHLREDIQWRAGFGIETVIARAFGVAQDDRTRHRPRSPRGLDIKSWDKTALARTWPLRPLNAFSLIPESKSTVGARHWFNFLRKVYTA